MLLFNFWQYFSLRGRKRNGIESNVGDGLMVLILVFTFGLIAFSFLMALVISLLRINVDLED